MEPLNQKILECLDQRIDFSLATIMTHKGSTPRTSGSKMIVLRDRTIFGTIGGGLMEAMVIDACVQSMKDNTCRIKEFDLNRELKDGLDMICGGNLTLLIEPFTPESCSFPDLAPVFHALADREEKGKKAFLVSRIQGFSQSGFSTFKSLALPNGTVYGNPLVPKTLFDAIGNNQFSSPFPVIYNPGMEEYIVEPISPPDTLYIFGAGHVGYQLARVAHVADFRTVIVDDREEFANLERFPNAGSIHVVQDFAHAFDSFTIDDSAYIVITTRGHLHDQTVLDKALKTPAAYIGMIGSKPKRNKIYANLKRSGTSQESLDRVFCPIGLEINSETPGEIAVSIMSQIILEKGRK